MATALFVADAEKVATVTVADNVEPAEGVSVAKVEVEAVASPVAEAHAVPVAENVRTPVPVEAVEGVAEEEAALDAERATLSELLVVGVAVALHVTVVEAVAHTETDTVEVGVKLGEAVRVGEDVLAADATGALVRVGVGGTVKDTEGTVVGVLVGARTVALGVPTAHVGEPVLDALAHALLEAPTCESEGAALEEGLTVGERVVVVDPEKEGVTEGEGETERVPTATVTDGLTDAEGLTEALGETLELRTPLRLMLVVGDTEGEGEEVCDADAEAPSRGLPVGVLATLTVRVCAGDAVVLGPPRHGEGELLEEGEERTLGVPEGQEERDSVREDEPVEEMHRLLVTVSVALPVAAEGEAEVEGQGDAVPLPEGERDTLVQLEADDDLAGDTESEGSSVAVTDTDCEKVLLSLGDSDVDTECVAEAEWLALEQPL